MNDWRGAQPEPVECVHQAVLGRTGNDELGVVEQCLRRTLDDDTDARVLAESDHGQRFAAVVGSGKHYGAQFHPERSSAAGLRLLDNFLKLPA